MRIIHVAGTSGAGKTTFIVDLIRRLAPIGKTAAVKHLGHHRYALEAGKDTTRYHAAGAAVSAGIDAEKAVLVAADADLDAVLSQLADAGVEYAIVEGFKTRAFPKIVIGDLAAENTVLRNPAVEEVVEALPRFQDYVTLPGLVAGLQREHGADRGAIVTYAGRVEDAGGREGARGPPPAAIALALEEIRRETEGMAGIIGVRLHCSPPGIVMIAVLAEDSAAAFQAADAAREKLMRRLHHTE